MNKYLLDVVQLNFEQYGSLKLTFKQRIKLLLKRNN